MQAEQFTVKDKAFFRDSANHFGIPVDNYISSFPHIGMQTVEIAQSGLCLQLDRYKLLGSKVLFHGAYDEDTWLPTLEQQKDLPAYVVPDEVAEFASSRNISAISVANVGSTLLDYLKEFNITVEQKVPIVKTRTTTTKCKLDSFLSLSITPLSTLSSARIQPTVIEKLKHR